jgi:predicted extracellular nuclease
MKKILSILSLAIMGGVMHAQVVTSSNLSSWSNGQPTDMFGSKTHTTDLTVEEVTEGSVYGTGDARLITTGTSHRRFSTKTVSVTADQGYHIQVWAKGQGDIRFGLYDGRPGESGGYSEYSAYNAVNSSTVTEYSANVMAVSTTANAEFIISVRNTVAPNHIIIDSIAVTMVEITPPTPIGIYDIQYTTDVTGDSPLKDQVVMTGGIVTAVRNDGRYWIQNGTGPWKGVYVYHQPTTPVQLGDSVVFSATVVEYFNLTELSFINNFEVVSSGNFFMATVINSGDLNSEAYEGCLVRVNNANCTTGLNNFNEWVVNDGSGNAKIDDFLYMYTPTVGTAYNVTGVVDFGFSEYKILPRDANDVSVAIVGVNEFDAATVSIYPIPAQETLNIEFATGIVRDVIITDASGKQIERFNSNGISRVNVANYAPGVYFVNVNGAVTRIVKQ